MTTNHEQSKGAVWRKWDLHVHTPDSSNRKEEHFWDTFLEKLAGNDLDVIGINDYCSVKGFKKINNPLKSDNSEFFKNDEEKRANIFKEIRKKVLFPVIEFRCFKKNGKDNNVNYHIIFDPNTDIELIENWLNNLKTGQEKTETVLQEKKKGTAEKDISVDFFECIKNLKENTELKDKSLVWLQYSGHGEARALDNLSKYIEEADIFATNNEKDIKFLNNESKTKYPRITAFKGSDYNCTTKDGRKIGLLSDNKHCWIKADKSFQGLKQVLQEPDNRVSISKKPPKRKLVKEQATKFLSKINIASNSSLFNNVTLDLNHDMVAIIGNKGSGKSALSDIISYSAGVTLKENDFSFLKRFFEKGDQKSITSKITWASNNERQVQSEKFNNENIDNVIYIPQQYFEQLCLPNSNSDLVGEIHKIIYENLPPETKESSTNLSSIIRDKSSSCDREIMALRQKIKEFSKDIEEINKTINTESIANTNLTNKKQEIEYHSSIKPKQIQKPEGLEKQQQVQEIKNVIKNLTTDISDKETSYKESKLAITSYKEFRIIFKKRQQSIKAQVQEINKELYKTIEPFIKTLDDHNKYDFSNILKTEIKLNLSEDAKSTLKNQYKTLEDKQAEESKHISELKEKLESERKKQDEIIKKLNTEQREYINYENELKEWEKKLKILEREKQNIENSLRVIKEDLPLKKENTFKKIEELSQKILEQYEEILKIKNELFEGIDNIIQEEGLLKESHNIECKGHIKTNKTILKNCIEEIVTKKTGKYRKESISDFINNEMSTKQEIFESIRNLLKEEKDKIQYKNGKSESDLIYYLWSLEYIETPYKILLDSKDLSSLSAGQRGAVLLIFYLLLDKRDIPVIIDQPEDNLDNQTIYEYLVPIIKRGKSKRQIIIVTHNPNIAVNCDAEQIIFAENKDGEITYKSGSIENESINKYITRILEGTKTAFDSRNSKYYAELAQDI